MLSWFNIIVHDLENYNIDISKHLYGKLLDIGCGKKQELFRNKVKTYIGLDNQKTLTVNEGRSSSDADIMGDAMNLPFRKGEFDCVIALSLLEHVPEPQLVVNEAYRVLKKGGTFALTVPFMNRLHMAPYDYFRFTEFGLRHILKKAGFKIIKIESSGGMWKMIGSRLSGYIYSDILGLGYGSDDLSVQRRPYLFPFFAPLIVLTVVMARFLDKVHMTDKDAVIYYALCKK